MEKKYSKDDLIDFATGREPAQGCDSCCGISDGSVRKRIDECSKEFGKWLVDNNAIYRGFGDTYIKGSYWKVGKSDNFSPVQYATIEEVYEVYLKELSSEKNENYEED